MADLVGGPAASARLPDDRGKACQHIFDAVIEFGGQQVLPLLVALAPRDIARQAFDAYNAATRVEFRPRGFLEPHLPAVGANETESDRAGTLGTGPAPVPPDGGAVRPAALRAALPRP